MTYYALLTAAVTMFSFQFLFNGIFEKEYGNGMKAMLVFTAGSSVAGLPILLILNNFRIECTPFSLIMAILAAVDAIAYNYFSLKSLGRINLSLYSMFAMLGGMALPFLTGLLFFGEEKTPGKFICFALIILSLLLTIKKGEKKSGYIYYMGVFILNGMSGVLSTVFQKAPFEKTSEAGYSVLIALVSLIIALVFLPFARDRKKRKITKKAVFSMTGYGILSRVANFLLLISLAHIPASAQYPFITGGVMIISTIISLFTPQKPSKREIAGVSLAFVALIILMFA